MTIDVQEVKQRASGRWSHVVAHVAPSAWMAIEKRPRHVGCPVHGGKDGFRLMPDFEHSGKGVCNTCGMFSDGLALIGWLNQWDFVTTLRAVAEVVGVDDGRNGARAEAKPLPAAAVEPSESPEQKAGKERMRREAMDAVMRGAHPLDLRYHAAQRRYLESRGFKRLVLDPPQALHAHSSLFYYEKTDGAEIKSNFPGIVAEVHNLQGEIVSLHRTYLTSMGHKALVASPKKLMTPVREGALKGAHIPLYPVTGDTLALAEGIETALAIRCGTQLPVWATLNAYGLATVELPPEVKRVLIYADNDSSEVGQEAAFKAKARFEAEGRKALIYIPKRNDEDWADVWLAKYRRCAEDNASLSVKRG